MKKYFSWFFALSEREQKMVSVASLVLVVALFYFLVWSPINSALHAQKTALLADQSLLTWVSDQSNKAIQLRRSGSNKTYTGSLTQLVNSSARRNEVTVSRMQPQGDNLQISIDRVNFDDLLNWIEFLESEGIIILNSNITETETAGIVQVRSLQIGKG